MDIEQAELENLLERAAEAGARKALADVGLQDDDAIHDVYELRNLLDSWRETKSAVGQTITRVVTLTILSGIAAVIGLQTSPIKMKELIKSELRLWAHRYLTPNNIHFNGMPACPFAETAIERDQVEIRMGFGWNYGDIMDTARRYPVNRSLVIHVELEPKKTSADFHADLNHINPQLAKSNM